MNQTADKERPLWAIPNPQAITPAEAMLVCWRDQLLWLSRRIRYRSVEAQRKPRQTASHSSIRLQDKAKAIRQANRLQELP